MPKPGAIPAAPEKQRRRLFAAGIVLALAAVAFVGFRDWMEYRRLGEENRDLTRRIAEAKRKRDVDLPRARERLAQLEDEQDRFHYLDRLPDEDRLNELFDRVSEFEQISGVEWLQSDTAERKGSRQRMESPLYERIQYTFNMRGEFFAFCKFINLLENMVRFATVDQFSVTRRARGRGVEDEGKNICEIKLTFSVYKLKASAAKPAARKRRPRGRSART